MIRRLLVPLDGSDFAAQALPIAAALALRCQAAVHLVTVHHPSLGFIDPAAGAVALAELEQSVRLQEEEYLQRKAAELTAQGIPVALSVRSGEPAAELARHAAAEAIDLVVMTTHGRGGVSRLWLGSVADRMIRKSERPVLLLRPDAIVSLDTLLADVLVPLDGSVRAESVIAKIEDLLGQAASTLRLVQVVVPPFVFLPPPPPGPGVEYPDSEPMQQRSLYAHRYLRRLARPLRAAGRSVATEVPVGSDPAAEVLATATRHRVGLIAIATHGRGGLDRVVMGSVADKIVRSGRAAVLVLPTHSAGAEDELSADYQAARREPDPAETAS